MIDRTLVSAAGAIFAAVVILLLADWVLGALERRGPAVAIAAGVAVFVALWVVDALTDYMNRGK